MDTAKIKTRVIVNNYKRLHHEEMLSFLSSHAKNVLQNKDKFGSVNSGTEFVERKAIEAPENLYNMLLAGLSPDEFKWLFSTEDKSHSGIKWLAKTFPEFSASEKI